MTFNQVPNDGQLIMLFITHGEEVFMFIGKYIESCSLTAINHNHGLYQYRVFEDQSMAHDFVMDKPKQLCNPMKGKITPYTKTTSFDINGIMDYPWLTCKWAPLTDQLMKEIPV